MEKGCCFTGYRPDKIEYFNDKYSEEFIALYKALRRKTEDAVCDGYTNFYCGFARGVDMLAAEVVLAVKSLYPHIRLIGVLPFKENNSHLTGKDAKRLLLSADETVVLSEFYHRSCYKDRNYYMVDHSQRVIAVYDGKHGGTHQTVNYSKQLGREVIIIDPNNPV